MRFSGKAASTARAKASPAVAALVLAFALLVPVAPASAQEPEVTPARIDGETRFHTAAEVAMATFDSSAAAIIASGEDYPDALVASYGPLGTDSPILLSHHGSVPQVSLDALDHLGVQTVYLVGGEAALGPDVETQLRDHGFDELFRVGGADRYETAAMMVDGPQAPEVGTLDGDRTALLASGLDFADALAAGPVAASEKFPLLLTPTNSPHPETDAALADLDIERIIVVGGTAAVSSAVVQHYEDEGYSMERWSGPTRTATASVVADNAVERLGFTQDLTLLARGDDYPDALTAGVHGGMLAAPLLLSATPQTLSGETRSWLQDACPEVEAVRAIGGVAAVSDEVLGEAVAAAEACEDAQNNQSFIIGPQEPIDADPGWEQEFHLIGTYDDGPMDVVELALFPCEAVQRDGAYVTFTEDPANPGYALGAGETDTGEAWISQINDHPQSEGQDRDRGMDPEDYNFHLLSNAPDCTLPVIWGTGEDEQPAELPIDENGEPTLRFGVGEIRWSG